jgi:hypothetical protein
MMMGRAIKSLCPEATFSVEEGDYSTVTWYNTPDTVPTAQQIQTEMARLAAADAALQYQTHRRAEYPRIQDQLDMLWHSMDTGEIAKSQAFYDAIAAVKNKYPKA